MDDNRKKALAAALSQIEKQFGKGSVMRMGDGTAVRNIEVISTGSLGLDVALGVGGLPRGRVVEIYGPESSGKTTLTLHVVAEAQKLGGTCAFIDAEHALDPVYAQKLGVNIDELLLSQPPDRAVLEVHRAAHSGLPVDGPTPGRVPQLGGGGDHRVADPAAGAQYHGSDPAQPLRPAGRTALTQGRGR